MALPSSRMPEELMEIEAAEKAAQVEKEKRKQLVLRISKVDIFKKIMVEWYDALTMREKQHLTPLQLKRRAIYVCSTTKLVYDTLPLDWVDELRTKCGLKLYQKKKRTYVQACGGSGGLDAPTAGPSSGSSSSADQKNAEKKRPRRLNDSNSDKGVEKPTATTTVQASSSNPNDSAPKKTQTKRFLDLSNDPPPPYWLKCYAEGKVLPRVLTIHSTDDSNILYYDYNPKLQDCFGREVKLTPQPRTNLDYFEGLQLIIKVSENDD